VKEEGEMLYMVLEFCDGGDLDNFVNASKGLSEVVVKQFMKDLGTFYW
jgi:hypothetical protein